MKEEQLRQEKKEPSPSLSQIFTNETDTFDEGEL